ncbi:MAG: hypothetical protein US31_C0015G0002 [Berkelbacteria bacterium GW2011_GWA1_36_9]|uniref:Uncharacterized protein n=1 Tax=Berkelbacteria bacterium GW2011_GWA1_36_9 TaxID=1618331 RepID=A0A0G0IP88_9BACT|nr:MAG: hypothetical protein US31_C0015G0002 [Berkelbacteria bacterium GW2011_GWA1_36_9]
MGESQSRYSIVERLTTMKLEIMNGKLALKDEVRNKEQNIAKLKNDLDNWKKDVQEDIKREQRKREIEIDRSAQDYKNAEEQMNDQIKVFEEQVKAIEEALKSIEEISKTSPTIQS